VGRRGLRLLGVLNESKSFAELPMKTPTSSAARRGAEVSRREQSSSEATKTLTEDALMKWTGLALVLTLAAALAPLASVEGADKEPSKPPAEKTLAGPDGLTITVRMQGPYDADVPLQIVCYFRKTATQKLQGAPVELDKRLGGVIGQLRDRGEFVGDELETLVLDTGKRIPARKLLLIGLGDEANLSFDLMERVGRTAYREAARLGATSVAFAPLLRDQGNNTLATGEVERRVIRGLLLARDTETRLQKEGLADKFVLKEWIVEAGPAYYEETIVGAGQGIEEATAIAKSRPSAPFAAAAP